MTAYETSVKAIQATILEALEQHSDPATVGIEIAKSVAPESISTTDSNPIKTPTSTEAALLSNAIFSTLLHLVDNAAKNGTQAMSLKVGTSIDQPAIAHLVDATLWLASQSPALIDAGIPALCIEIVTESVTNAECSGVLAYLDSRLPEFKKQNIVSKSHLTLLRTCNLLLKRLSKSQDASLCGRVLMFLAKFLPLTERSGVNLYGTFHIENITPVEEVDPGAVDAEGTPIDISFYKTFWGLQKWFSNPPSAIATASAWNEIQSSINTVLDKFSSEKVTVTETAPITHEDITSITTVITTNTTGHAMPKSPEKKTLLPATKSTKNEMNLDVKYLSSARLLPLQLRDATFRRHFLIQCIVLLGWIERPAFKEWANQGAKGKVLEDLGQLRSKIYKIMEKTPEKGREFTAVIQSLMQGEDTWVTWKQAGCPPEPLHVDDAKVPVKMDEVVVAPAYKRPKLSQDAVFGVRVGSEELDRLWNLTEDNLSMLGADDRGGFKSLRQLMEPVIEEMNEPPGEETDESFKASKNVVYSWKTMRMVARDSLPAFASSVKRKSDLYVAARALYPDEVPPEPEVLEQKKEEENVEEEEERKKDSVKKKKSDMMDVDDEEKDTKKENVEEEERKNEQGDDIAMDDDDDDQGKDKNPGKEEEKIGEDEVEDE